MQCIEALEQNKIHFTAKHDMNDWHEALGMVGRTPDIDSVQLSHKAAHLTLQFFFSRTSEQFVLDTTVERFLPTLSTHREGLPLWLRNLLEYT
jgi:hypothetical protein